MPDVNEIFAKMHDPSPADKDFIAKAYAFAEEAHKNHLREQGGEPYFIHLFETALTLAELGMGPVTIAAGFLHDSIEDVAVKPETIKEAFGDEVLFLVEGVTKLGKLQYSGAERYTESLRKLFVAMSKDVRVLIIKLSDRLNNMKTLHVLPPDKQKRIALETLEIFAPLAYRIGIRKLNRELEDLAFPYVLPKECDRVKELLKEKSRSNIEQLEKFRKAMMRELAREGITNIKIGYRVKGLYSLYRKLVRKNWDIEKIYDILALRIIVPSDEDCYRVLGAIHGVWRPLPGRIKDYIALPKPDSYRGIHTTIFTGDGGMVEIQIRTEEMHRRTEYGMHFEYKETLGGKKMISLDTLTWVRQFIPSFLGGIKKSDDSGHGNGNRDSNDVPSWVKELGAYRAEKTGHADYMSGIKTDFFGDRVFVFTPQGDVIDLPAGSTPIDFAYTIHSEIGDHLSGAKVNSKLVTIDTELVSGDIVEISTKPAAHPSAKWLEIAKTTLARKHIKSRLGAAEHKEGATAVSHHGHPSEHRHGHRAHSHLGRTRGASAA